MTDHHASAPARRPSRRTVARGAAWSVPVLAVGAAAPAFAASGGTGTITGACLGGNRASYTLNVTGSAAAFIRVTFSRLGGTSMSISVPGSWVLVGASSNLSIYDVPVIAGSAGGAATVTFQMGQNGNELVTATISTTTGQVITGDTTASVNITRNGSSTNYNCSVTG
jgi:hypothetical protein